jgi:hypothetical protein
MAFNKKSRRGAPGGRGGEPKEEQASFEQLEKRVVWNVDMGAVDQVDQTDAPATGA